MNIHVPASPTQPAALADGVSLVEAHAGLLALRPDWLRLEAAPGDNGAPFFQSFEWISHVARVRLARDPSFRILVAVLRGDGRVRAIWPLALFRQGGLSLIQNLDDPFGQFAGVLAEPGVNQPDFIAETCRAVAPMADGLRIAHVPSVSSLKLGLVAAGGEVTETIDTVFVDMHGFEGFAQYQQTTGSKTRKILRNMRNRLERDYRMAHETGTDPAIVASAIEYAFAERLAWTKRNGRFSSAFNMDFFGELLQGLPQSGVATEGFVLKADDQIVSAHFGFRHGDKFYSYMTGLNPDFAEFSAGRIHLGKVLQACFENDLRKVELMPPVSRYKLEWRAQTRSLETVVLPLTLKGRLLLSLRVRVMPLLRRASRLLPEGLRRRLVNSLKPNAEPAPTPPGEAH